MNFSVKKLKNTVLLTLACLPGIALAAPITYDITDGSSGGFTASWLHAGTGAQSAGFYMNGNKASISGSITIDWATGAASGSLSTDTPSDTNFGQGSGSWVVDILGGSVADIGTFNNGDSLLLSLDYLLSVDGVASSTGTFYFADSTFTGDVNSATNSEIYLWGNNWFNQNGTADKTAFELANGAGSALGIDLYGTAVPEPGILLLLGMGLIGLGIRRKRLAA